MRFTSGTRLNQYELRSLIATGGGGEVYLAYDTQLARTVALKVLAATADNGISHSQVALLEEARAASVLNHPNILTIYEIGRADSIVFMATEFVEGETLRTRLSCQPLPLRDALNISSQIASALSAAHSKGLIHGDLKPENITLRADGLVKILDFGLARCALTQDVRLQENGSTNATKAGISGTLGYLAPEQLRGHQPDARTDLWAFGVVLFEMLTGKRPFARTTVEDELRAIQDEEQPPLSTLRVQVPLALESIVRRALTKDPNERYQSATEILSDLRLLAEQLSIDSLRRAPIKLPSENSANESLVPETTIPTPYRSRHSSARWSFSSQSSRRRLLWIGTALIVLALIMLPFTGARAGFLYGVISIFVLGVTCLAVRFIPVNVKVRTRTAPAVSVAFRGLVPFQEADRDSFYGRDIETGTLFAMVAREPFRFGTLFGESGCGKTSLLLAGLIPKLWGEGYVPLYCRSFTDPLAAVLDECRKRSHLQQKADETTIAYLRRVVREFDAPLIIICDQFEEFFVNFRDASERELFITFVSDCHNEPELPVRFLFSLRSDFLYLINSAFTGRISEPLLSSKLYHLRNFDEDVAEEILQRSARSAALPFEPGLSGQIARDLAVNHLVAPSEMQIVGAQLQARRVFTLDAYHRAGGKEALVHDFLEDVIQASGDADSARLFLRSLISDENTRLTLPVDEIVKRTQRSRQTIERILNLFVSARLVEEIQEDEPWRYELMHEYLIERINQVTGRVMDATQRANRLFKQSLSHYAVDKRTRIPINRLLFIRRYSDVERGERERELLKKSLRHGLIKASAIALLLALAAMVVAAAFSVREEWTTTRLSDGHTAAARRIAFSPDGRLLVSVGEDAKVIVWDFARRERIATLEDHTGWVNSVAFSPDGKWFATASDDQTVIVWDASRQEKAAVLTGHERPVKSVAFSPDGKLLASASDAEGYATILWDVGRWEEIRRVPVTTSSWWHLHFTSDGRYLLSSILAVQEPTSGAAWDLTTEKQATDFYELQCGGTDIAISPDDHLIASVDGEGYVKFADLTTRRFLEKIRAHRFHGRAMAFSPDGRLLASGAEDIVLWDPYTRTRLQRLEHSADVWSLAFSPDGRWLVSSHSDGAILLWDAKEREAVANLNEHYRSVRSVAFSADGKRLASASEDRSIIIWDAERTRKEAVLAGHNTRVTAVAFSPDGQSVASCDQDAEVRLWDVGERKPRWTFKHPRGGSYCLAFSPDGRYVATSNCVNDSADGRMILDLITRYNTGAIYGASFSGDGRRLACVSEFGWVLLWDTASWQLLDTFQLPGAHIISASFSPDGKSLVTGDDEGDVRLWEVSPLRPVAVIGRHAARIKSVAFSSDGREVVSASDDQSIALWDVAGQRLITHLGTHTAPVLAVDFAPDGKRIAAGGQDKSAHIYTRHRTLWGYNLE